MSISTSQIAVQSAYQLFHTSSASGILPGYYSFTVSVDSTCSCHVSAHLHMSLLTIFIADIKWLNSCFRYMYLDSWLSHQYTRVCWAFQGMHRSQDSGCDKHGVNMLCAGDVVMINVGLAQARPNSCLWMIESAGSINTSLVPAPKLFFYNNML